MKLLTKSEITVAKNKGIQKEKDEGMKVAKQVDSLREIKAAEEASLMKFRDKTLKAIKEDIQKESGPLETLRNEVKTLQVARLEALAPLDEERSKLAVERGNLEAEKQSLFIWESQIKEKEGILNQTLKEAENEYQRADQERKQSTALLQDASILKKETQVAYEVADATKAKSIELSNRLTSEFAQRDASIASRERSQTQRDKDQDAREQALNNREVYLGDQEEMLKRNLKR